MTGFEHGERYPSERRKSLRIPITVSVKINVSDGESGLFHAAQMLDYSAGGVGLAWNPCSDCTGYKPGGIDPDCLLAPFDMDRDDSRELDFHLELGNYDQDIRFKGKAVYTLREDGMEKVGIVFTEMSDEMLKFMRKVL